MTSIEPITDDKVKVVFNAINLDKNLKEKEKNEKLDKECPLLKAYLDHCCKQRNYFFSIKKCGTIGCTTCAPIRLPRDVFDRLSHLPDPIPDENNEGHYKKFESVFGMPTTEEHMPSKKTATRQSHGIPFQPHKQHALNTNLTIVCVYCHKPRLAYSKNKISRNIFTKFKRETSELQFVCGTTVEELTGADNFKDIFVRGNLRCDTTVEVIYYSVGYVSCCTHCGATRRLTTGNHEYPMCSLCKTDPAKKPVVRRQNFQNKNKK